MTESTVDTRVILAGLWVAIMLTYLLGDVLRIMAGDAVPGEMAGKPASGAMWLAAALIMLVPIVMLVLSLTLPFPLVGWVSLVVTVVVVVFNIFGLPYKGMYDNALIAWYAWGWLSAGA